MCKKIICSLLFFLSTPSLSSCGLSCLANQTAFEYLINDEGYSYDDNINCFDSSRYGVSCKIPNFEYKFLDGLDGVEIIGDLTIHGVSKFVKSKLSLGNFFEGRIRVDFSPKEIYPLGNLRITDPEVNEIIKNSTFSFYLDNSQTNSLIKSNFKLKISHKDNQFELQLRLKSYSENMKKNDEVIRELFGCFVEPSCIKKVKKSNIAYHLDELYFEDALVRGNINKEVSSYLCGDAPGYICKTGDNRIQFFMTKKNADAKISLGKIIEGKAAQDLNFR